jgi:hypothetical protein
MKKIFEFVNNDNKQKVFKLLDGFLFFDGDVWMFPNSHEFISNVVSDVIKVDDFIKLGFKLAENLNKINIGVLDYDVGSIENYINS